MEILNWRDIVGKPSQVGEFDLYIPEWGMTIFNFRAIRTKKGTCFAAAPSFGREQDDGTKKFFPYISFSKERQDKFNASVNALLTPYIRDPNE